MVIGSWQQRQDLEGEGLERRIGLEGACKCNACCLRLPRTVGIVYTVVKHEFTATRFGHPRGRGLNEFLA